MKTIAVLGSGMVGETLAQGLLQQGYPVIVGTQQAGKKLRAPALSAVEVGDYRRAAGRADLALLAVKGTAAEGVVSGLADVLAGKTVLDATNPIADTPPENGVLHFFTTLERSLLERLQTAAPEARFVKAFNSVGAALMVQPKLV